MAKFKKLAIISSAVLMTTAFAFGVAACEEETPAAHVHSYSESWVTDATHHWYGCTGTDCSSTVGKTEHVWNDGEETANGENTVKCVVCGYEKKETVATKLAVGEDTTVKVVAGTATEVAVDATAGSYTISWTNPKTIVKVGETEYKKADNEDAEGYVGTADLLWIEDGVKVTVGTTDGSAADIVISCAKYSAPQLMSYDHSAMMAMMTSGEMPELETVASGERGTQFSIYAQNPGWYYVGVSAEDGEDDANTPDVVENDYTATISVSASNAYTTPATVTEGMVAIEVPANSVIDVVVTHDASTAIDVMAYAMYMIEANPNASNWSDAYINSLAEVTISINPMSQPVQMQELFVPMASRVYGRLLNVVNPVQVSWNNPNLVFDIAGTVYTQEDCPVKVERDTFNPTGVYFTAYTTDGQPAMDVIEFSQAPVSEITLGDQSVAVDPMANQATKYIATATGTYTFTIDYDIAMELGLEQVSINATTLDNYYPDSWYASDANENEDIVYSLNVAKGAEIEWFIFHEESNVQVVPFNVAYTAFASAGTLNAPTSDTPATTQFTIGNKEIKTVSLVAGSYVWSCIGEDGDNIVLINASVNGTTLGDGQTFHLFEEGEITIAVQMFTSGWGQLEGGTANLTVTLEQGVAPTVAAIGENTIANMEPWAEQTCCFTATEAGSYTFTVTGWSCIGCDLFYINSQTENTSTSIELDAGETFVFTVGYTGDEAGNATFTITKNA